MRRFSLQHYHASVSAFVAVSSVSHAQPPAKTGTVSHDAARERALLEQVQVADGFKATLFAAPPIATQPVGSANQREKKVQNFFTIMSRTKNRLRLYAQRPRQVPTADRF